MTREKAVDLEMNAQQGLPKGWVLVVLLNRGWNSGGKDSSSQGPRPAASSPWGARRGMTAPCGPGSAGRWTA
jgi:hypothetical protein